MQQRDQDRDDCALHLMLHQQAKLSIKSESEEGEEERVEGGEENCERGKFFKAKEFKFQ
jgi:hypothetical protein